MVWSQNDESWFKKKEGRRQPVWICEVNWVSTLFSLCLVPPDADHASFICTLVFYVVTAD